MKITDIQDSIRVTTNIDELESIKRWYYFVKHHHQQSKQDEELIAEIDDIINKNSEAVCVTR